VGKSRAKRTSTDWLAQSTLPIYLLDEQRFVVFANAPLAEWVGLPLEQIVGTRLVYGAASLVARDAAGLLRGLCPPPGAERLATLVSALGRDGRVRHRDVQFISLALPDEESSPLLAVVGNHDKSPLELADSMGSTPTPQRLHRQLQSWRAQNHGLWPAEFLLGHSPAAVRLRNQIDVAVASRASTLLRGSIASDLAIVARLIHADRSTGDTQARSLLVADARLSTVAELTTLVSTAARQTTPTTLLIEHVEQLDAAAAELVLCTDNTLPPCVQRVATLVVAENSLLPASKGAALAMAQATLAIDVASLAARADDLPLLAQAVIENQNIEGVHQIAGIDDNAAATLTLYDWPGGFVEFESLVRQAHRHARGALIELGDLPSVLHHARGQSLAEGARPPSISIDDTLLQVQLSLVERALALGKGNKAEAARLLGVSRPRLYRLLETLGLATPDDELPE
jgi:hypothetical protein